MNRDQYMRARLAAIETLENPGATEAERTAAEIVLRNLPEPTEKDYLDLSQPKERDDG